MSYVIFWVCKQYVNISINLAIKRKRMKTTENTLDSQDARLYHKRREHVFPPLELLVDPRKDYNSTHLLLGVDWTVVSSFN